MYSKRFFGMWQTVDRIGILSGIMSVIDAKNLGLSLLSAGVYVMFQAFKGTIRHYHPRRINRHFRVIFLT